MREYFGQTWFCIICIDSTKIVEYRR